MIIDIHNIYNHNIRNCYLAAAPVSGVECVMCVIQRTLWLPVCPSTECPSESGFSVRAQVQRSFVVDTLKWGNLWVNFHMRDSAGNWESCWSVGSPTWVGWGGGGVMGWGSMIPVPEPSPVQSCTECGTALPVHPLPSPHTRQPYLAAFPQGPDVRTLVSFQSKAEAYLALINICYSTGL